MNLGEGGRGEEKGKERKRLLGQERALLIVGLVWEEFCSLGIGGRAEGDWSQNRRL